ncbi:ribosome-recycling factor [Clostridium sp. CAG:1219]|nr:ribosome-recycling factor [Clostridium sp. CAG:1219]
MELNILEDKMKKAIEHLEEEYSTIRAGRANPAILNKVQVEYYGALTPINQVGSISVPEARQILITPWDRTVLSAIEKAINKAEIGVNPINDGSCIRLNFPELNEERRKELVKEVKKLAENGKVAVRNVRRDGMEMVKAEQKNGDITEDELKFLEEKIQKMTDNYVEKIDVVSENKEKEVMEV